MRQVGIITHYHNSVNYGGVLQAYALCRILGECGIQAEQICYQPSSPEEYAERKSFFQRILNVFRPEILMDYLNSKVETVKNNSIADIMAKRRENFRSFGRDHVPHSETVYDVQTMAEAGETYRNFITGSDQVWNLDWFQGPYFLNFVPAGKKKISYAASLGMRSLTETQQETFRKLLADFTGVSVREEDAVTMLQPLSPVDVNCTLDPTLLLTAGQWDAVCAERLEQQPYLFCYFLGENKQLRKLARAYARSHGLKLVSIPHANGLYTEGDKAFGDVQFEDVSPMEFLSLVKYADCIFTNSFHAAVFSGIYEKQYFVFPRRKQDRMVSRIYTLTGYFGSAHHFCDTEDRQTLSYINAVQPICYDRPFETLLARRAASIDFLKNNLA